MSRTRMTPEARRRLRTLNADAIGQPAPEIEQTAKEPTCPMCRIRYRIGEPMERDFSFISVSENTYAYLLAAALEFDKTTQELTPGECWTAVDFIDWLRDSLVEAA